MSSIFVLKPNCSLPILNWMKLIVFFLIAVFFRQVYAQAPLNDYRGTAEGKLSAAKKHVEAILAEDAKPQRGFYGRQVKFPVWNDQTYLDCASFAVARAVRAQEPVFEGQDQRVVHVPVFAELLAIHASKEGGKLAATDGSLPSKCAFEYERWSFDHKRFEKIDGFRQRTHYEEFSTWGESIVLSKISRWVVVAPSNRYVRFVLRINVTKPVPYQLAPQFPVHYSAENALQILQRFNQNKENLIKQGVSDRDEKATGDDLREDLARMKKQLSDDTWVEQRLRDLLKKLQDKKSFEELK